MSSTPEEQELDRKRRERIDLEEELAQRELQVQTLKIELAQFRLLYFSKVGAKYDELNALEAEISNLSLQDVSSRRATAEPQSDTSSPSPDLWDMFEKARADGTAVRDAEMREVAEKMRAEGTPIDWVQVYRRVLADRQRDQGLDSGPTVASTLADELKRLYRQLAKLVHPDLIVDEAVRERRRLLMAEINEAYESGDLDRLKGLFKQWQVSPLNVEGEGAGAELVRIIREIAQVRARLDSLAEEIASLEQTDLYRLKTKADEAYIDGRDLLEEIVQELECRIAEARIRRDRLVAQAR